MEQFVKGAEENGILQDDRLIRCSNGQSYIITKLSEDMYEVRTKQQIKTYYLLNLKNGCSCGKKECNHKKAVNEWTSKRREMGSIRLKAAQSQANFIL